MSKVDCMPDSSVGFVSTIIISKKICESIGITVENIEAPGTEKVVRLAEEDVIMQTGVPECCKQRTFSVHPAS